nr:RecName: Full=Putative uncharacterized protein PXBL-III [Bovine leukemia virus (JAPANESE ISOLATE BLV-1)]
HHSLCAFWVRIFPTQLPLFTPCCTPFLEIPENLSSHPEEGCGSEVKIARAATSLSFYSTLARPRVLSPLTEVQNFLYKGMLGSKCAQYLFQKVLMNVFPCNKPQQRHSSHIQQHLGRLF